MPMFVDLTDRELETLAIDCLNDIKETMNSFINQEINNGVAMDETETVTFHK
ncbi:hypothetical protein LCGC14_2960890, partial [marine sediment metagenome]